MSTTHARIKPGTLRQVMAIAAVEGLDVATVVQRAVLAYLDTLGADTRDLVAGVEKKHGNRVNRKPL